MVKLNLGCRSDYKEGWVNTEIDRTCKADVYFDLTQYPYPFKDNEFDIVLAHMILKHIPQPNKVLKELHRITKDGGKIYILVPHSSDPLRYSDITHINFFNSTTFKCGRNNDLYPLFEEEKCRLSFARINNLWLNKIINPIINLFPVIYERLFTGLIQVSCIAFILKVRKDKEFYESRLKEIKDGEIKAGKKWSNNFEFIRDI